MNRLTDFLLDTLVFILAIPIIALGTIIWLLTLPINLVGIIIIKIKERKEK